MSRNEYLLGGSGFLGLVVGLGIGLYQTLLSDPMLLGGAQAVPEWLIGVHVHFIGLSLIAIVFSWYVDDLFPERGLFPAIGVVLGQWLVPGALSLVYLTGVGSFGMLILVGAVASVAATLAFAIQFLRVGPGDQ